MKAIVCEKYGPPLEVLQLKEVDRPIPTEKHVLVKVIASSVNKADAAPIRGSIVVRLFGTGWLRPKQPLQGTDVAGRVESVGQGVTRFKPGDEVFGAANGSYAEYALAREEYLVMKPSNVSFEAAATLPIAAISALQGLRAGKIQAGQKVLVYGASGGVGTFAVQIAKAFGAEVTAVCSPHNLEQTRRIGADHVVDYTQTDVTRSGNFYDLILAVNGSHPLKDYLRVLTPQGRCVIVGGDMPQIFQSMLLGPLLSKKEGQKIGMMGIAKFNQPDLETLRDLLASGKIQPVIDRSYPLSQTAQAILYQEAGHAPGKVVITVAES